MLTRDHQGIISALERFEGRKFDYEPRNAVEERLRLRLTDRKRRAIRRRCRCRRFAGCRYEAGRAARGPQG